VYHIEVNGHGSNFGRTGKVRSVGKQRLTIDFDDNNPKGLYVSWWDAMLIDGPSVPRPTTTEFIDRTPGSRAAEPTIIERVVHVSDNVTTLPHVERPNGERGTRSRTERRLNFDGQNENRPRDNPPNRVSTVSHDADWDDVGEEQSNDWNMERQRPEYRATGIAAVHSNAREQEASSDVSTISELSRLLEHMAFTSATLISSAHSEPREMEHILQEYIRAVRNNTTNIANSKDRSDQRHRQA
jgi:hypothetical protein